MTRKRRVTYAEGFRMRLSYRCIHVLAIIVMIIMTSSIRADEWPQWMGPQRDSVWRETGIVREFPAGGPPVRWRIKIGGGYAGPAVVGKHVYVTDKQLPVGTADPSNPFARGRQQAT